MPAKKYVVRLSGEEREQLEERIAKGTAKAYEQRHARMLLKVDAGEGGPGWTDRETGEALEVDETTVARVRRRYCEEGLAAAVGRREQSRRKERVFDGQAEARLLLLACSRPPDGRVRWTMRLLAEKAVEMRIVERGCPETVRQTLKKTQSSRG